MSDADHDVKKDAEQTRLMKVVPETAVKILRRLYPDVCNYNQIKRDLIKLGYRVEESGLKVKVWKEI